MLFSLFFTASNLAFMILQSVTVLLDLQWFCKGVAVGVRSSTLEHDPFTYAIFTIFHSISSTKCNEAMIPYFAE